MQIQLIRRKRRIVGATYDGVFEATKEAFLDMGLKITAGSKDSGFLNGKRTREDPGRLMAALGRGTGIIDSFNVSFDKKRARVTVRLRITAGFSDDPLSSPVFIKEFYDEFWAALDRHNQFQRSGPQM